MVDEERRTSGSSLELLLDTMCNTFGGVMFIAISLVVIAAMLPPVSPSRPIAETEEAAGIRRELEQLQSRLEAIRKEREELEPFRKLQNNDARAKLLEELAALRESRDQAEMGRNLAAAARRALELETASSLRELAECEKKLSRLDETITELKRNHSDILEQISDLQNKEETLSPMLEFAVLTERQERPYYLLLNCGKLWRIGPEELPDGASRPSDEMESEISGDLVICRPRAEKGIPVFAGEAFSSEFTALLSAIPAGRIPSFQLGSADAETFFRLRGMLKQQGVLHGFTLTDAPDRFQYRMVKHAKYEY